MLPDYADGSLVNLMASVAAALGGRPRHAPLALLGPDRIRAAHHVVLLIVDGLGDNYLRSRASALAGRRLGALTSVFPSTTASAITTTYTGASPLEHGLTGWFTLLGAAACVAAPLPFEARGGRRPLAARGVSPAAVFAQPSIFDDLDAATVVVTAARIVDSTYNLHHCGRAARRAYDSIDGFVAQIEAAVRMAAARTLVYAYWPEFDSTAHRHGVGSVQAAAEFAAIDGAFARLLERLRGTDTLVIATADHGFIDTPEDQALRLEDGPGLAALLRYPLCGEPRAAWCHVQRGRVAEFRARASEWLEGRAEVRASAELVAEGWFGGGVPHPHFAERIGEVALVMRDRYTIRDRVPGESGHRHIGNHGGISEDEMRIPLVVAET